MSFISGLLTMLIVAFLFTKIRGFIFAKIKAKAHVKHLARTLAKDEKALQEISEEYLKIAEETLPTQLKALELNELNASIGRSYKRGAFSFKKFKDNFTVTKEEGKKWGKTLGWWINWRNWTIIGLIVGSVFAYGYFKGRGNTPVQILDYATEFRLNMNGEYLHKPKFSNDLYLKDSKTDKIIKPFYAKDFPLIAKKLKPIGFILEPIFVAGIGASNIKSGFEAGAGVSFIKYWRYKLDAFLTNRGIYLGTHYQITSNSGLGLGVGKGFDASNRMILYYKFKF